MLLDVSDRDGVDKAGAINLQSWPAVKGMYQPDAITTFKADGKRCKSCFALLRFAPLGGDAGSLAFLFRARLASLPPFVCAAVVVADSAPRHIFPL